MEAAAELFNAGKIKFIIVSGDNSVNEYNETRDMKKSLIAMGVPEDKIIEDFAGFRTLDSVIRAKEVFGRDSIIVISQKFQNQRAIFIGKNHDIYALGFNAREVPKRYSTLTETREYFARVKAVLDVYVLAKMPKFYKDKVFRMMNNKLIIGIAGGTGSGKTTVVQKIMRNLETENVLVISQDNYYGIIPICRLAKE